MVDYVKASNKKHRPINSIQTFAKLLWKHRLPYLLFLPSFLLITGLMFYPLLTGLLLSLQSKSLLSPVSEFVGFANFQRLFADPIFWQALRNSFIWTLVGVLGQFLLGLGLALLLNIRFRLRQTFRSLFLFPWMMPSIVVGIIWVWMFNDLYGFINYFLTEWGLLRSPILFLANPDIAIYSVTLPLIWRGFPFVMLVFLASLQSIDTHLYEAAQIDGANAFSQFWHITLPGLRPAMTVIILLETIWVFNNFEFVHILTGGGPANATELLSTYSYRTAFEGFQASYGATVATIQFFILLIFSTLYLKYYSRTEED